MPTGARIIVLERSGVYVIREVDLPDPGPGQVLLQVLAAGVGHQQLHRVIEPPGELTLAGSEAVGRVMRAGAGDGVQSLDEGGLVVVTPYGGVEAGAAGVSVELDEGETEPAPLFTWGTNAVLDARFVVPIADLPDRDAAGVIGTTVLTAVAAVDQAAVDEAASVAVFGAAGTGLSCVVAARHAGAGTIVAVDRDAGRLERAEALGATHVIRAATATALDEIRAATSGQGADALFDCGYEYQTRERPGMRAVRDGGAAYLLGTPGTEGEFEEFTRRASEGSYQLLDTSRIDAAALVSRVRGWIDAGTFTPSSIVTARYTIEAVNEAVRDLENGDIAGQGLIVIEALR